MKYIGVTARVDLHTFDEDRRERRDALDQDLVRFLMKCDLCPIILPNNEKTLEALLHKVPFEGFVLSGGNSLVKLGGNAPERDSFERGLLRYAIDSEIPILGICRGMQLIQDYFSVPLEKVTGHVSTRHRIASGFIVNSFHNYGSRETVPELLVKERAPDDVVESITHRTLPIKGIMWHPEREVRAHVRDVMLFREHFKT